MCIVPIGCNVNRLIVLSSMFMDPLIPGVDCLRLVCLHAGVHACDVIDMALYLYGELLVSPIKVRPVCGGSVVAAKVMLVAQYAN